MKSTMMPETDLIRNGLCFAVLSASCYFIYWYAYGRFQLFKNLGIPGPKPALFVGNTYQILKTYRDRLHIYVHENILKHKGMFGMYFFGVPTYVVWDRDMIREICVKQFDKFCDRQHRQVRPYPLNLMLGQLLGDHWKFVRSKLSPSFTTAKLRDLNTLFNDATDTAIKLIEHDKKLGSVDITKIFQGFSMEAIISASFGVKSESQTPVNMKIVSLAKEFFIGQPTWHKMVALLPFGTYLTPYIPCRFFNCVSELFNNAKQVFRDRKVKGQEKQDLLQLMIDSQRAGKGKGLSDDEIFASSCIFLVAGYETSSTSLATLIYELARHPEYQEKLYDEINAIWTDKSIMPSYEDVQKTNYMDTLLNELLRVYPPGTITSRACNKTCTINGVKFFQGTNVIIPIYSLHYDPTKWEKPTESYPDHFSDEARNKRDDVDFMPFGYGPRNCIGMRFAIMEMKIILMRLIGKYKFIWADETPRKLTLTMTITNVPRHPILLKVVSR